ncbi:MAG: histone deacetylase, partial [Proteobacteria bacterium]
MVLPVVNHKDYFAKIGDDHKFPINKFSELAKYLKEKKIVKEFINPSPCSIETLSKAHSLDYINN